MKLDFCRCPGGEVVQDSIEIDSVWIGNDAAGIEIEDESIHLTRPIYDRKFLETG